MKKMIKNDYRFNRKSNRGFTLIELIVVMAIIAILVLLAAPKFLNKTSSAKETATKHDSKVLENSAEILFMENHDFLNNLEVIALEELQPLVNSGELWGPNGKVSSLNPSLTYYKAPKSFIKENLGVSWNNGDGYLSSELEGFVSKKINSGTVVGVIKKEPVDFNCNLSSVNLEDWEYSELQQASWPFSAEKELYISDYKGLEKNIAIPTNIDGSPAPYLLTVYSATTTFESLCIPSGFTEARTQLVNAGPNLAVKAASGLKMLNFMYSSFDYGQSIVPNGVILAGTSLENFQILLKDSGHDYVFVDMGGSGNQSALPSNTINKTQFFAEIGNTSGTNINQFNLKNVSLNKVYALVNVPEE